MTGSVLVFTGCMTAYTTPQLLGGTDTRVLATMIYQYAMSLRDWTQASVVAVVMIVVTMMISGVFNALSRKINPMAQGGKANMALLELKGITAGYGQNVILRDFNLNVERGEFVSLLGSSGCGKTTTLRLIAGFSEPMQGTISFDGRDYTHVPLHKRNFGFVFQSYALFPHMTVFDNVAFGLKMRKLDKAAIQRDVMQMLKLVDLEGFENRYPREMSGGQRQRVALARAMVIKPDLMLFDEPLSNLDAKLRVKMRVEIRRIQQELGFTAIYVTHDQEECFAISDKVAIMNKGLIEQMDAPSTIYNSPNTEFIARFVGFENFFELTRMQSGGFAAADGTAIRVADQKPGERFKGCIRPEDVQVRPAGEKGPNAIPGEVMVSTFLGRHNQLNVKTAIGEFVVSADQTQAFPIGTAVTLVLTENKIKLIG